MTSKARALPFPADLILLAAPDPLTSPRVRNALAATPAPLYRLLANDDGREALEQHFVSHVQLGLEAKTGVLLEAPTLRASAEWGGLLGDDAAALDWFNVRAVGLLLGIRARFETASTPIVVGGTVGPRFPPGEGAVMTASAAAAYHARQVRQLSEAGAGIVAGRHLSTIAEAVGLADAAEANAARCVISLQVNADGSLPTGEELADVVNEVDQATGGSVLAFALEGVEAQALDAVLQKGGDPLAARIRGVRCGDPSKKQSSLVDVATFGRNLVALRDRNPQLMLLGGGDGTDERHVQAIASRLI